MAGHPEPNPRIYLLLAQSRIAICLTPKVASSSIIAAFLEYRGLPSNGMLHLNPALDFVGRDKVDRVCRGWRTAMFVRNPFDRLVAVWRFHFPATGLRYCANMRRLGFRGGMSFTAFVDKVLQDPAQDPHTALQSSQFERADFVGRIEAIGEDWQRFRAFTGLALPDLAVRNATDHEGRSYRDFYTPAFAAIVGQAYAVDLTAFGYDF